MQRKDQYSNYRAESPQKATPRQGSAAWLKTPGRLGLEGVLEINK
jgi:hypothetical protein